MAYTFGDCLEITCQHTLGEFRFSPKANEGFDLDPGGIRADDDASMVTSNGQNMNKLNRVKWSVEGPIAVDMISGNELTNIKTLSAHPEDGVWTISFISGTIYKGKGRPVGDISTNTNEGTMPLKLSGGGELEKI